MGEIKVSVIIPTFNESESIHLVVRAISSALSEFKHEIIVVDDDSKDGTLEVVLGEKIPEVRCIRRTSDKGFAKSIRRGIEEAVGSVIVIMDSDFNHDPQLLPFMIRNLDYFDCVSASRFLYGGRGANPSRHLLSWAYNIFLRLLIDGRITDNLFGFFAIRAESIKSLDYDKIFWGFGDYAIRFLYYLQKADFSILQFPAVLQPRVGGQGNRRIVSTFFQYTIASLKLVFKEGRLKLVKHSQNVRSTNRKNISGVSSRE
jgi:dolichol-phosphate mannosyltransferase